MSRQATKTYTIFILIQSKSSCVLTPAALLTSPLDAGTVSLGTDVLLYRAYNTPSTNMLTHSVLIRMSDSAIRFHVTLINNYYITPLNQTHSRYDALPLLSLLSAANTISKKKGWACSREYSSSTELSEGKSLLSTIAKGHE